MFYDKVIEHSPIQSKLLVRMVIRQFSAWLQGFWFRDTLKEFVTTFKAESWNHHTVKIC